jgi:hypothetical protein
MYLPGFPPFDLPDERLGIAQYPPLQIGEFFI